MAIIEKRPLKWGLWIGLILLAIAGAAAFVLVPYFNSNTAEAAPFEITDFSGKPEFYSSQKKAWVPVERGMLFTGRDKIRTNGDSEVNFNLGDKIRFRLKENSQLEGVRPKLFAPKEKELKSRLHLLKGTLLGATDKKNHEAGIGPLEISTPSLVAAIRGTVFEVSVDSETGKSSVGVLSGKIEVKSKIGDTVWVTDTQKVEAKQDGTWISEKPMKITSDEWKEMKEAYELLERSAAAEAKQLDLSKKAGSLFQYVFDHGTFYIKKVAFADREFMIDPNTNQVYLNTTYDVFPPGAYVGIYMKTRNFDISKFKGLEFDIRKVGDDTFPDTFRVEMKSKFMIIQAISPKVVKKDWDTVRFLFGIKNPTPITEMVILYANDKVGNNKKGSLEFRNFNLIPYTPEELEAREKQQPAKKTAAAGTKPAAASKPQVSAASKPETVSSAPATSSEKSSGFKKVRL